MQNNEKSYEKRDYMRPGDQVIRIKTRRRRRMLRIVPNIPGILRFFWNIVNETPFVPLLIVLVALWLCFSLGVYFAERLVNEQFHSYGYTLWWIFTAMQTQGANSPGPVTPSGILIGAIWSIIGTVIFFGVIIATIFVANSTQNAPDSFKKAQVLPEFTESMQLRELLYILLGNKGRRHLELRQKANDGFSEYSG